MAESFERLITVGEIYRLLDEIAPFDAQESWDNAGLLAGSAEMPVKKALVALDLTRAVIDEADAIGAQLVVTHHPILFHARKNLREDDPEGRLICQLIRARLALIACHTNWDLAPGGVGDCLARAIGLEDIQALPEGLRIGAFGGPRGALLAAVGRAIGGSPRLYGGPDEAAGPVAVLGGAGGSFWRAAFDAGARTLVTGEVKHNELLEAVDWGMGVIVGGHYETEKISVNALASRLQIAANALQYSLTVASSRSLSFT